MLIANTKKPKQKRIKKEKNDFSSCFMSVGEKKKYMYKNQLNDLYLKCYIFTLEKKQKNMQHKEISFK